MTYREALAYLESFVNFERSHEPEAMRGVRLERMERLCRRLGDPQRTFRSILVAGTNGKGSTCAMIYSILRESGLRVGLYTSPHTEHLRERIRFWTSPPGQDEPAPRAHRDDWIGEQEFGETLERMRPALEALRRDVPLGAPTYFEVMTAMAFACFRAHGVEVAVLEAGLGGRLDATNVVRQAVSVFSAIDLDHADILGADPASIAGEKAGIIKPGQTALSAPQAEAVAEVLRQRCEAQGVPLFFCGRDLTARIQAHGLEGLQVTVTALRGIYESLEIPLIGRHQAMNAALAIGAVEALSATGVPYRPVEQGLRLVQWPGRLEVVNEAPLVILDGAHNSQAVGALAETLAELCHDRTIHVLVGMSSDKSPEGLGQLLGGLAAGVTCTKSRHPRALDPTELAGRLSGFCRDVHVMSDPIDAYTYLLNALSSRDALVVTGSLFLVGELRAALRQSHTRVREPSASETAST